MFTINASRNTKPTLCTSWYKVLLRTSEPGRFHLCCLVWSSSKWSRGIVCAYSKSKMNRESWGKVVGYVGGPWIFQSPEATWRLKAWACTRTTPRTLAHMSQGNLGARVLLHSCFVFLVVPRHRGVLHRRVLFNSCLSSCNLIETWFVYAWRIPLYSRETDCFCPKWNNK